jgi:hypothetical protein
VYVIPSPLYPQIDEVVDVGSSLMQSIKDDSQQDGASHRALHHNALLKVCLTDGKQQVISCVLILYAS